jgi:hypothetical protein
MDSFRVGLHCRCLVTKESQKFSVRTVDLRAEVRNRELPIWSKSDTTAPQCSVRGRQNKWLRTGRLWLDFLYRFWGLSLLRLCVQNGSDIRSVSSSYIGFRKGGKAVTAWSFLLSIYSFICCYLMTLCQELRVYSFEWKDDRWTMNWKRCRMKRSWPDFKVISWHFPGRTEENHENPQSE